MTKRIALLQGERVVQQLLVLLLHVPEALSLLAQLGFAKSSLAS